MITLRKASLAGAFRTFVDLQRATWAVSARTLALPILSLASRRDRHLAWRLNEVCFGTQRPGVYPEFSLGMVVDRHTSVKIVELPGESYDVAEYELLAISTI